LPYIVIDAQLFSSLLLIYGGEIPDFPCDLLSHSTVLSAVKARRRPPSALKGFSAT
jgi:hypothetical protein